MQKLGGLTSIAAWTLAGKLATTASAALGNSRTAFDAPAAVEAVTLLHRDPDHQLLQLPALVHPPHHHHLPY